MENYYKRFQHYKYSTVIPMLLILTDFSLILILLDAMRKFWPAFQQDTEDYLLVNLIVSLCWVLAGFTTASYQVENQSNNKKIVLRKLASFVIFMAIVYIMLIIKGELHLHSDTLLYMGLSIFVVLTIVKMIMLRIYRIFSGILSKRKNVIIVGNTYMAKQMGAYFLSNSSLNVKYFGFFDKNEPADEHQKTLYLGKLEDVKQFCKENYVNEIYCCSEQEPEYLNDLLAFANKNFIFLGIIPFVGNFDRSMKLDTMFFNNNRIPVITTVKSPLQSSYNSQVKRVFDIFFSFFALLFLCVTVFPVIAILIKLESPGPVIFKQMRPGRNNRLFWCYKFRTMKVNNEGQKQATKNDSRITKVGAFLRKTSMDELPQFFNVLIGNMSVVGPRPNLITHLKECPKEIKDYPLRHWVTPGITGFAQVSGYRGETKHSYLMKKRVEFDLKYMENWSLTLDLQIIVRTILNAVKGEDKAY